MTRSIDLTGRTALVSGASRGIGRAIALGLAEAGADVVGLARSESALADLGRAVEERGRRFLALPLDLARVEEIPAAVARAGDVDVLVNAAGVIVRSEPPDVTPADWDAMFAVNVRGTFFLTQEVGARMLGGRGGSIVSVASLAGELSTRAAVGYQASKAALIQMTRGLAARWGPSVRLNAVGPGYIRTDLNAAWLDVEENRDYVVTRTPLGRVGEIADVVGAVIFLASPDASYVTGQTLRIDGGWSAR